METPTKVIADYLDSMLKRGASMITEGLTDTLQALKDFKKANTAKHVGEIKGWHVTTAAEEDNLMFCYCLTGRSTATNMGLPIYRIMNKC